MIDDFLLILNKDNELDTILPMKIENLDELQVKFKEEINQIHNLFVKYLLNYISKIHKIEDQKKKDINDSLNCLLYIFQLVETKENRDDIYNYNFKGLKINDSDSK